MGDDDRFEKNECQYVALREGGRQRNFRWNFKVEERRMALEETQQSTAVWLAGSPSNETSRQRG